MISHEDEIKYRLECLKMAYEIGFKVGHLKDKYEPDQKLTKEIHEVFILADVNFNFINEGTLPFSEEPEGE